MRHDCDNMITFEQAKKGIEYFNKETQYPASDAAITAAFSAPVTTHTHFIRFALLDTLFATNLMRSKPSGNTKRMLLSEISENIRVSLNDIEQKMHEFGSLDLMTVDLEDEQIQRVIEGVITSIIDCCNNQALSFSTKYLHFVYPAFFAPWDSIVPSIAGWLFPDLRFSGRKPADKYMALLVAHQRIWSGFTEEEQRELLRYDFETQPARWQQHSTPVRIVDKILWSVGKKKRDEKGAKGSPESSSNIRKNSSKSMRKL